MVFEIELRSFLKEEDYTRLLDYFMKNAEFAGRDVQETHYLDSESDLRIQKNDSYSKVWVKSGKIHDECREELEVRFKKEDFENIEKIFKIIGLNTNIKWFRTRNSFRYRGISVYLDYTIGYGYIIELEKLCNSENEKEKILDGLNGLMKELCVNMSPREDFERKLKDYKKNWRTLLLNKNE